MDLLLHELLILSFGWHGIKICQTFPSDGLYFKLDSVIHLPGDTILITDVGDSFPAADGNTGDPSLAGPSLVCVTTNINTACCRGSDGGNAGEWFFPDGTMVPRQSGNEFADFTRSGFSQQVRLNHRNGATSPTGVYSCRVPDMSGTEITASITLEADTATEEATTTEADTTTKVYTTEEVTSGLSAATKPSTVFFQLRLLAVGNCDSWQLENNITGDRAAVGAIVTNIVSRCNCNFTEDHIRNREFLCFPSSPQAVTYRGELHGTLQTSASDLITNMEEWVASGAFISVQFELLTVDGSCSVAINSLTEMECMTNRGMPSSSSTVGISLGVIVSVAVMVLIITMMTFCLASRKWRDTFRDKFLRRGETVENDYKNAKCNVTFPRLAEMMTQQPGSRALTSAQAPCPTSVSTVTKDQRLEGEKEGEEEEEEEVCEELYEELYYEEVN